MVPAYREAERVRRVVAGIPRWVDHVVVVDDASDDGTVAALEGYEDARLRVERHSDNRGVGAAITTGYLTLHALGAEVCAVMAGDDQMDPADLESVVGPVAEGVADYVKGNRFVHPERRRMPRLRRWGSRFLAGVTRAASGLDVDDTQCGYTALAGKLIPKLPLEDLWPRYGYPNDLLLLLAREGARIVEVPVRPVYAGEASGLRPYHVLGILRVIGARWWRIERERRRAHSFASPHESSLTDTSVAPAASRSSRKR